MLISRDDDWLRMPNWLFRVTPLVRYELFHRLSVFAGLTLNAALQIDPERRVAVDPLVATTRATAAGSDASVRYWPGFTLGVRL